MPVIGYISKYVPGIYAANIVVDEEGEYMGIFNNKGERVYKTYKTFSALSQSNKIVLALMRLEYENDLDEEEKSIYTEYIRSAGMRLVKILIDQDAIKTLSIAAKYHIIKKSNINKIVEYANKNGSEEAKAYISEKENEIFSEKKEEED